MSRIHDALKRAEQQRETGESTAPVAAIAGEAAVPPPPPPAPAFGQESLLERCRRVEWTPDKNTMLFFDGDDTRPGTEEFRTLRSRLYAVREVKQLRTILVTSALPKEGKSFTAANLAQAMVRQHGRRVLLIDCDLRAPRLHQLLGASGTPGVTDYLQGQSDEFSIMQCGPLENLFFIPSGQQSDHPAELVANGRMKLLLQNVESLFDWIVVDSPPAVPVADAGMLAKMCDGVLMVVRSNATPADVAQKARAEFAEEALIGVVLNGSKNDKSPYAGYYYEADRTRAKPAKA
jgi:capsular exopolysaccharide synthesis family protein